MRVFGVVGGCLYQEIHKRGLVSLKTPQLVEMNDCE